MGNIYSELDMALKRLGDNCFRILKANITRDTFEILFTRESHRVLYDGILEYKKGLSGLWDSYIRCAQVFQADLADFKQYANLDFLSAFLKKYHGKESFGIDFRCLENGEEQRVHFEILSAFDYSDDNQSIYLFLKNDGDKMHEDYLKVDDLLQGLSENYGAIYFVDFDKNLVRPFRMNEAIEEAFGDYFRTLPTYEDAINGYIDRIIAKRDKASMYEVTRYDFLKKMLRHERAFSHEYHVERGGREYVFRMKVANLEGIGELHKAVMGFADVSMEKVSDFHSIGSGNKIMIVDADPIERGKLAQIVATQYEVILAENGQEALDYLEKYYEDIALVLTELYLPVMDGYELIRQMKNIRQYCNTPIIVVTDTMFGFAGEKEQMEVECLEFGASDFILKPYNAKVVLNRIKSLIRLRESVSLLSNLERDPLTGLLAKEFFFLRTSEVLTANPEVDYIMWVADILDLKLINEKYGFDMGDDILKIMAADSKRFHGFILGGRIEGDKFAALIEEKYFEEYKEIVSTHDMGIDFPLTSVVIKHGFYHIRRRSSLRPQGMYDRAVIALQKIKVTYGVYWAEYDDEIRKDLLAHRLIAEGADIALAEHQFVVYYQPKFDIKKGKTSGAEALIRWIHPELGFMNPGVFLAQFEQNGFIKEVDLYVWEDVCKMLFEWKQSGRKLIPISINASRRDFEDPNFVDEVMEIVDRYGIDHCFYHIEITESAYSDNPEQIKSMIRRFHDNGFVVELDDFGAGYSSMTALSELDLDVMKLDMSIIQNDDPSSDKNILEFSMHLAKMMRLQTVAEGVETEAQVERITSLGGDYIQGYFYSKPLPREQFEEYLEHEAHNYKQK